MATEKTIFLYCYYGFFDNGKWVILKPFNLIFLSSLDFKLNYVEDNPI